jgi:hypothetical protein
MFLGASWLCASSYVKTFLVALEPGRGRGPMQPANYRSLSYRPLYPADSMFLLMTSIVCCSSSVGLNSTTSVPAWRKGR